MTLAAAIEGGFASPVFDAQAVFRSVMEAMARPGRIAPLAARAAPPAPLFATSAAIALTLFDHDTPVWLDQPLRGNASVGAWLGFHTGAPLAPTAVDAAFALAAEPESLPALDAFAQGSQDYPDRSTTLVLQIGSLTEGPKLVLQGPGIDGMAELAPALPTRHFIEQWKANGARFPRGVDLILAAPDCIACLPRTTRIRGG